MNLLEVSPRS